MSYEISKFPFKAELASASFNAKFEEIETYINNLSSEVETLRTENQELRQLLNNKVGNNNDNAFLYRGTISNFDEALKTGWYTFVNISNWGYGVLIVQNSTGESHNNLNNWIWQTTYNTGGATKRRFKVNSDNWTNWIVA